MAKQLMIINRGCRVCGQRSWRRFLKLGPQPLANSFLKTSDRKSINHELFFPLDVYFCNRCGLVQLRHIVNPQIMFRHYLYVSSTSPVFVDHFQLMAEAVVQRFKLTQKDLVVDVGANDGILLKPFKRHGIRVLGVDPAKNIVAGTRARGIKVITDFFSYKLAQKMRQRYGPARIITGTNVFAHINALQDTVEGVKALLSEDGVLVIEVPYLVDFITKNLFDTVYHEHLSYFSVKPLQQLFATAGMEVFDVERVPVHGGSIRVWVQKTGGGQRRQARVKRLLQLERSRGLHQLNTYLGFARRVRQNKTRLRRLILRLRRQGKRIAGFGAAAKGNTLLNYFKVDAQTLDFIVDDSPLKQGYFTPGTHIPVVPPEELYSHRPDYVLILAWNFAAPIMLKHKKLKRLGTRFIVPVPRPRVV